MQQVLPDGTIFKNYLLKLLTTPVRRHCALHFNQNLLPIFTTKFRVAVTVKPW
jgi:hypothetical protein